MEDPKSEHRGPAARRRLRPRPLSSTSLHSGQCLCSAIQARDGSTSLRWRQGIAAPAVHGQQPHVRHIRLTEACRHATHTTSWLLSRHEGPGGCMCEGRQARAHSCAHLGKRCALWTGTMKISAPSRVQMHALRGPPSRWSSAHAAQPRSMDELRCGGSRQELGVARAEKSAVTFVNDGNRDRSSSFCMFSQLNACEIAHYDELGAPPSPRDLCGWVEHDGA